MRVQEIYNFSAQLSSLCSCLHQEEIDLLRVGINGEELDGKYKAKPINYRMSQGERLEIYKSLFQDPKERRKNKANLEKDS